MPTKRELESKNPIKLLDKIKQEFSELKWSDYRFINHGWDHEVIILDDKWVFRFPNSNLYLQALARELAMLQKLNTRFSDLLIPKYEYIASDGSFAGYKMLTGKELTVDRYNHLSESSKRIVIESLASFLTQLHSTDIAEANRYVVSEIWDHPSIDELEKRVKKYLKPRLSSDDYKLAEITLAKLGILYKCELIVLIHGDLSKNHILWDEQSKSIRIIDFSDRALADPAYDFAELEDYGQEFLKEVYDKYEGNKDEDFLLRASLYHKRISLYLLINSCIDNKITWDEAKILFDRLHG